MSLIDLKYEKKTGNFYWAKKGRRRTLGARAGSTNQDGYVLMRVNKKSFYAHQLVWFIEKGKWPAKGFDLDHVNGCRSDNRIENLRLCTRRENLINSLKHRQGKLPGCYFNKPLRKWQAQILIRGKRKTLGFYKTEKEASRAYRKAFKNV